MADDGPQCALDALDAQFAAENRTPDGSSYTVATTESEIDQVAEGGGGCGGGAFGSILTSIGNHKSVSD